jgi:hypothetical protein
MLARVTSFVRGHVRVAQVLAHAVPSGVALASLAAAALALALPANAGVVTGVTASVPSPAFKGTCPAAMAVQGAIAGTKGAGVTYNFVYYDPASKSTVALAPVSVSIGGSGIVPVTATLSIAVAHAGPSWVQLVAKAAGQSLASNKAAFSVTCTTSTPPPAQGTRSIASMGILRQRMLLPNPVGIAVPTGLTSTLAQQDCSAHGGFAGGLACMAGIPQGWLPLIWNFCSGCTADGFHVYRIDGGHHDLVPIPANGPGVTLAVLNVPPGGFAGKCYAVAAFRGSLESTLSNPFCVRSGGGPLHTVFLRPIHERSSEAEASWSAVPMLGCAGGQWSHTENNPDGLWVGYYHAVWAVWNESPVGIPLPCHDWDNRLDRGAIAFDVSSLQGKHIYLAYVHLTVDTTQIYDYGQTGGIDRSHYLTDHATSCASHVGLGQNAWWNGTGWIPTTASAYIAERQGPNVTYDVTSLMSPMVSGWNFGLVFTGDYTLDGSANPNLGGGELDVNAVPSMCLTHYRDVITLEVKYS